MKMNLYKPCSECPFTTTCLKGWLGESRAQEIADSLLADASFPCHKTSDGDDEGERRRTADESHCAGALILLEKMERPNQWMRWMERLRMYDRRKLDMSSPVFDTAEAFVDHHSERHKKRARRGKKQP